MLNLIAKSCLAVALMATSFMAQADNVRFSSRTDVTQFINLLVKKDHFDREEITTLLDQVQIQPTILEKMQRPYEDKPWYQYRDFFMTEERLSRGIAFWKEHEKQLLRAEQQYGVPAEIIVSILGVETLYGTFRGDYRVLDALATLAFNYPPRSAFFQSELRHFLLLAREQKFSPTALKGSYAGAMGYPQFMPSSYRTFAVDFTGNGHIDLLANPNDAIGSIGNYFKMHGWQTDAPIALPAKVSASDELPIYLEKPPEKALRFRPQWKLQTLRKHGIDTEIELDPDLKACLVDLKEKDEIQYWLGFHNLYVITRYNSSINYAMVVFDLSQRLRAAHDTPAPRAF